jgi:tetratricopeptide (TPR) repeat protein
MYSKKDKKKILELAEKYVKKGKLQEAILEYQKLSTADPHDLNLRSIIGDLYIQSGQKDKAITEFKKTVQLYEKKGLVNQSLAIYKKMNRIDPKDTETAIKLGGLLQNQGYLQEAKKKYLSAADILRKTGKIKEAISCFEKILKIDTEDYQAKIFLAELYSNEGMIPMAVNELNEVAEQKIKNNELKQAKEILIKAKSLQEDELRTLLNLIEIFKKQNKKQEAMGFLDDVLKKDENNLQALGVMGNLLYESREFSKAEETFKKIISLRPKDVEARVKLGRIHVQEGNLDDAYNLYEPLVDSLLKRQKDDKAIGLLGLILATKKAHLKTLDKLASIYKSKKQVDSVALVYKAILNECRKKDWKEKTLATLKEILKVFPMDEEYYSEYRKLKRQMGLSEEEVPEEPPVILNETKEIIAEGFGQADLYVEQGLIRNARRILESLRTKFPDDSAIEKKIKTLNQISPKVKKDEIPARVEKVAEEEVLKLGKDIKRKKRMPRSGLEEGEETLTAADVFAETDIIPIISQDEKELKYYELAGRVNEELKSIQRICHRQIKGDTTDVEKELSEIVAIFKKNVQQKIDKKDYESHFNLGIAYLEQGLLDEAVEELQLACQSEKRKIDCFSILSHCHKKKKEYQKAFECLEHALDSTKKGTGQYYGLKYEMASLYEVMQEKKKALTVYREVKKWNPQYRDTADKIEKLEKARRS